MVVNPQVGRRVRVANWHRWNANERGVIKQIMGTKILVKFDDDRFPHWHDDDRDPVLYLNDIDLIYEEYS